MTVGLMAKVDALETQVADGFAAVKASSAASSSAAGGGDKVTVGEARLLGKLLTAFWTEARKSLMMNPITHFTPAEAWRYAKDHSLLRGQLTPELMQRLEVSTNIQGERNCSYHSVVLFNQNKNITAFKSRSDAMTGSFYQVVLNLQGSLTDRLENVPNCFDARNLLLMSIDVGSSEGGYAAAKTEAEDLLMRTLYKCALVCVNNLKISKFCVRPLAEDSSTGHRAFDPVEHLNYTEKNSERTVYEWKSYSDATGITTDR
jgi:hypothetical protein